jgi:SNF2 family DNA or RNA helicase
MAKSLYTAAHLETAFEAGTLSRGRAYWQRGAVQKLRIEHNGEQLFAQVQGSDAELYGVNVEIMPGYPLASGKISLPRFSGECTCPVGYDCKHAVAVCYAALAAMGLVDPKSGQSGEAWETWLASLEILRETAAPIPPPVHQQAIFYMLESGMASNRPQARIRPIISGLVKNGEYRAPRDMQPHQWNSGAKYITAEDLAIKTLMHGPGYYYGGDFQSPPTDADLFDLVLRRVLATGRCFFESLATGPLAAAEPRTGELGWQLAADGTQTPAIIVPEHSGLRILPAGRPWYVDPAALQAGPVELAAAPALVSAYLAGPRLSPKTVRTVARKMATRIGAQALAITPPVAIEIEQRAVTPTPCLRLALPASDDETSRPLGLVHFDYAGKEVDPNIAGDPLQHRLAERLLIMPRDRRSEGRAVDRLTAGTGLSPVYSARPAGVPPARLAYGFEKRLHWVDFLQHTVPALRDEGWRVSIDSRFTERFQAVEIDEGEDAWEADLREQEGGAWWFSLDLGIMVEGQRVALLPLLVQALKRLPEATTAAIDTLARSGTLYVDLPDGRPLALPFERVREILTTLVELFDRPLNPDGSLTVPIDLATALSRIDAATKLRWLGGERLQTLVARLKTFGGLTAIPPPAGLRATLRPYQLEGLNWLQFLRDYGLGGILADDMGLGKTVQTLAHVLVEKEAGRLDRPCLIICPTSLIPNWQDEAAKFAPDLRVLVLHGGDRAGRFAEIADAELVLTTYPLLPRDADSLRPIDWHMIVLDEAQAIKNPAARITQIVCELRARHRLCLTGTPIENHLGEAWAHFAFLMPGMLDTHKEFTKRFRNPIEKQRDADRQALLARRLKPFILRRNKSEVAKELPAKTEIIQHVDFALPQRDLYETVRLTMHEKVREAVEGKGFNRSRIVILDALLKLRQACCDPRLVKVPGAKKIGQSAKLEALLGMLPEMLEEGRSILLFSQFTSMLDLIKPELDKLQIPFVEIRGDTKDRKTPVARFQGGEVKLFLISLKAGGTGLNLTAADTVIHYDPWWNPAVEAQATDRAHRIGQDKPVFVYKFIARNTVEERILELQTRKRALAAALLEERPDATAALEASDLDFLFQEAS